MQEMEPIKPYRWQEHAVDVATLCGRGTIGATTGSGKSLVIALIAHALQVKTLVVVPSLEIKKQLIASLSERFKDMSWIDVENIDSSALDSGAYGCLIIDEAHHGAAKTYRNLNKMVWGSIYHRFFLTATPFRNDLEEELLLESLTGDIIYNLDYKQAVESEYVVPVEGYFIEIRKQKTEAYTYAQVYSELVVNNTIRNLLISNLILKLDASNKSTLCLVREVRHGKLLADMTGVPFVNGEDEESRQYIRQFNSGGINTLIATTGIMGEGVDTKPCEYVVIAGLGKAKSQFMQQVGRGVRIYPGKETAKVILIKDKSHKFLTRHFNAQVAILKDEYGIKPLKLDVE